MTSAWDAWPAPHPGTSSPRTPPLSLSPLSRSPSKSAAVAAAVAAAAATASPTAAVSPQSFDRSWILHARMAASPPPPADLPLLPPEILRKIIHHALDAGPSRPAPFPRSADADGPRAAAPRYDPAWDVYAARGARRAAHQRAAARASIMRTARSLMAVCRAWKHLVPRYMYAEPHLTGDNLSAMARAVVLGDRKWSDINLHPHSTPGRWITVLDLSNVEFGFSSTGSFAVGRACATILELAPSVTHLRLPPVQLGNLHLAACVRKLRALEGLLLCSADDEEQAIRLLRMTKGLEVLGLVWVGYVTTVARLDGEPFRVEDDTPTTGELVLDTLHTLTLGEGRPGPLLAALTRAVLPSLTRLVTSPYEAALTAFDDDPDLGGPRALQVAHGHSVLSLTFVSTPDWPRRNLLPPMDTLALHPNLVHLHLGLPHALLDAHPELGAALGSPHHRLAVVTLPRWPRVVAGADTSPAPIFPPPPPGGGPAAPSGNAFLAALCANSKVTTVAVDGFTWVAPALGRWAAESGDSGMMRQWGVWLARRGVELRDQEGATAPVLERGRASFGGGMGLPGIMGRRSVDGGRRSFDGGWPR